LSTDGRPATDATSTAPANGVASHPSSEPLLDNMALAREIVDLEKQFPPPDQDALLADARWFEAHYAQPELSQYRGSFVAVRNGAVVGHGPNALQLQLDVARRLNVHPESFLVELILPSMFEYAVHLCSTLGITDT
jgi:hypothetical protein